MLDCQGCFRILHSRITALLSAFPAPYSVITLLTSIVSSSRMRLRRWDDPFCQLSNVICKNGLSLHSSISLFIVLSPFCPDTFIYRKIWESGFLVYGSLFGCDGKLSDHTEVSWTRHLDRVAIETVNQSILNLNIEDFQRLEVLVDIIATCS